MITFNEVLRELEAGNSVELRYDLGNEHFSTHELTLDEGMIYDYCHEDCSTTVSSVKEFKYIFYCEAFKFKMTELDENNV